MLKLAFDDMFAVTVVENDRGEWTANVTADGTTILSGYGGENFAYIVPMTMSDCGVDIVLVHSMCDSPSKVVQRTINLKYTNPDFRNSYKPSVYNSFLNELAKEAGMLDPLEE